MEQSIEDVRVMVTALAAARRSAVFGATVIPGITARLRERPAPASEVLQV